MFVQVINGRTSQPEALAEAFDRWKAELSPGATGWLGSTGGVTDDGTVIAVARFESEEAARANSARPEQDAWWSAGPPGRQVLVLGEQGVSSRNVSAARWPAPAPAGRRSPATAEQHGAVRAGDVGAGVRGVALLRHLAGLVAQRVAPRRDPLARLELLAAVTGVLHVRRQPECADEVGLTRHRGGRGRRRAGTPGRGRATTLPRGGPTARRSRTSKRRGRTGRRAPRRCRTRPRTEPGEPEGYLLRLRHQEARHDQRPPGQHVEVPGRDDHGPVDDLARREGGDVDDQTREHGGQPERDLGDVDRPGEDREQQVDRLKSSSSSTPRATGRRPHRRLRRPEAWGRSGR